MKENEILDYTPQVQTQKVKEFRPAAIILEGLFLLLTLVGTIWGPYSMLVIAACTLAMIYFAMSWYLFKADKFRPWDLVFSILGGMVLNVTVMGYLFQNMHWEGAWEMVTVSLMTSSAALLAFSIRYVLKRKNFLEYRLSLKMISRILVFLLATFLI